MSAKSRTIFKSILDDDAFLTDKCFEWKADFIYQLAFYVTYPMSKKENAIRCSTRIDHQAQSLDLVLVDDLHLYFFVPCC